MIQQSAVSGSSSKLLQVSTTDCKVKCKTASVVFGQFITGICGENRMEKSHGSSGSEVLTVVFLDTFHFGRTHQM